MTPGEILRAIDAAIWQIEAGHKRDITLAWNTAVLIRRKRIPSLGSLLHHKPARPLTGPELEEKRREFEDWKKRIDLDRLNEHLKDRLGGLHGATRKP